MSTEIQKFDALRAEIQKTTTPALLVKVGDMETKTDAELTAKQVKALHDAIEAKRVELTKPLLEQKRLVDEYAKKLKEPCDAAIRHIKSELVGFERQLEEERRKAAAELERKRKEEEARIKALEEAEAKRKQDELDAYALFNAAPPEPEPLADEGDFKTAELEREKFLSEKRLADEARAVEDHRVSNTSRVWVFDVVDANAVPREYLVVDEKKIRAAVRAGAREIPGVKIYQDVKVSIR